MTTRRLVVSLVLLCSIGACADASIRKVPNRSDYEVWGDDQQWKADSMCGLRFYRTRPYVVVHQPFPLPPSESFLIDGTVSADGRFIRLNPKASRAGTKEAACLAEGLKHFSSGDDYVIPDSALWRGQSPARGAGGDIPSAEGGDVVTSPALLATPTHAKAEDRPSGTMTIAMQTALEAIATKKLGERFEVIYLPDFEEEYVIDPRANLGDLRVAFTQGPGGELLAMGMQVDNSAITKPLVEAYTKAVDAIGSRITTALGTDPTDSLVTPNAEGGDVGTPKLAAGSPITVRVHVISMASPGIYPILKADEVLDSRNCLREFVRCHKCKGQRVPCSDCKSRAQACCNGDCPDLCMLPCGFPGSRVVYERYRVMIVENLISSPAGARLVGLAEGGDTVPSAPKGVLISSLADMKAFLKALFAKRKELRCVVLKSIDGMAPPAGGAPEAIEFVEITLGFSGSPSPAEAEQCKKLVATIVREALPKLREGDAGLVVK